MLGEKQCPFSDLRGDFAPLTHLTRFALEVPPLSDRGWLGSLNGHCFFAINNSMQR